MQDPKCEVCSFENPSEARFCQKCGHPLPRLCPACGLPNDPEVNFCKRCGASLVEASDAGSAKNRRRRHMNMTYVQPWVEGF